MMKAARVDENSACNHAAIFWNKNCFDNRNTLSSSDFINITGTIDLSNIYIFKPTIGEGSYYNAMCPTNILVGYVAMAMGQVMHYWQHMELAHIHTPTMALRIP